MRRVTGKNKRRESRREGKWKERRKRSNLGREGREWRKGREGTDKNNR